MRKGLASIVSVLMAGMLVLTACSGGGSDKEGQTNAPSQSASAGGANQTAPGTYPIVQDPITLKVLVVGTPVVEDWENNEFTKWYEEKTNIMLDFEVTPNGSNANEIFNLTMASGALPDVILSFDVTPTQQMLYGQQGSFVPLNDLIEQYGPNTKKMFEQYPAVKDAITAPGGHIYALPQISSCYQCSLFHKAWIYKPWLDKLGLEMPRTTEQFYEVLKAFKTQDPNDNGKADEIPLASAAIRKGWGPFFDRFLMDAFVNNAQFNEIMRLSLNEGKIEADYVKPEWKQGIEWVKKLYSEGLIAPESFTMDENQLKELSFKDGVVTVGVLRAPGVSTGFNLFDPSTNDTGWDYVAVPPLEGPNGFRSTPWNPYPFVVSPGTFIITSANKYPAETMRWADGFYTEEVTLKWSGIPSDAYKLWDRKDPNVLGMDGKPALYENLETHNTVSNIHWGQRGISLRDDAFWLGMRVTEKTKDQLVLYEETRDKYEPYKQDIATIVPPLFFTEEQASELADLHTTINDYVIEMFSKFVTGSEDIATGWQGYLDNLKRMGLERYLAIYQEAYDAKFN